MMEADDCRLSPTKVGKLIIVDIHGKAFLNLLLDIVVSQWRMTYLNPVYQAPLRHGRIDHINPALVPLLFIVKACRQI